MTGICAKPTSMTTPYLTAWGVFPKLLQTKYSYFQKLCYHCAFPEKRGAIHGTDSNTPAAA
jgi:hypothetical protein